MDLGTRHEQAGRYDGLSASELYGEIRTSQQLRRRAELDEYLAILAWADQHTVDDETVAATAWAAFCDTGLPIAGPGTPLVSEFAAMELIAVLGRSPESGRSYLGQCLELAWRLPSCHAQVLAGKVKLYKALEVADHTRGLSVEAAGFVDRHLAFALPTCTWAQIERLITEAMLRFDPETAEEKRRAAHEQRRFDIDLDPIEGHGRNGLARVDAVLDAADAKDLDTAIARRAKVLGRLGSEESLDVRRARAAGELARDDLALDLETLDTDTGEVKVVAKGRRMVLNIHLSEDALTSGPFGLGTGVVGRWEDTRTPISAEQIKAWCQAPGTTIVVRPVIDLADHVPLDSYEIPDRLRQQVALRDLHCAFPNCGQPSTRCDLDHATPYADGGPTCPCNLVPLCRKHHRAKTHSFDLDGWSYIVVDPGTYLWRSPHTQWFLVDHHGTRHLDEPIGFGCHPPDQ